MAGAGGAEAAGLEAGPCWVLGGAAGGFAAAAGWLCASESWPVTEVGFGVVLGLPAGVALTLAAGDALVAGEVAGLAAGEVWGAALGDSAAMGPAAAGFLSANSATVNFIASLIGMRATPLVLSTQP